MAPSKKNDSSMELLREIAIIVGGKNAGVIVDLLAVPKHVNEFTVAKKLELTINQTRNILYKLADEGLVSSIRKKDKKKGWYTYFWIFNSDKAFLLLKKLILEEIENLENQLSNREAKQFYVCKICKTELTEENALLQDFTCPECGEIYESKDNSQVISEIKVGIGKLKNKLEDVNTFLGEIEEKKNKKLEREKKKLEKEKLIKRQEAAKKRAKTRKAKQALEKKTKKVVKKTTKKTTKVAKKIKKKAAKKAAKKTTKKAKKVAKKKTSKKK